MAESKSPNATSSIATDQSADQSAVRIHPDFGDDVTAQWFDPAFWSDRAVPVGSGGRGSAWFVESPVGPLVLRFYRRGGMVAAVSDSSYLFTGEQRVRSFAEFELLKTLSEDGLPVPKPVAATYRRRNHLWYQASILIERIVDAVPMPDADALDSTELWTAVGQTIRRFHDHGVDHVDLNCDNILIRGDSVTLIDFDRCRLRNTAGGSDWRQGNLDRLRRSVDKRCGRFSDARRDALWSALVDGYRNGTPAS
ncbi:3-deoxy-D-manno-octulosonic acid kinase [Marinobacter sp. JSM 1782161]|uniref:3-deoxy-D-manno-octulosonic acid kinase n=1 Tax=Marinobacter sp. JSM 1782161 TaxID=2685906 RepID=UPI0014028C69|nr:3-deoxy-D-manno-octulosonic acid kinase [Marinobacter sp. JSM 1782161]